MKIPTWLASVLATAMVAALGYELVKLDGIEGDITEIKVHVANLEGRISPRVANLGTNWSAMPAWIP